MVFQWNWLLLRSRRSSPLCSESRFPGAGYGVQRLRFGLLQGMADRNLLPYIDILSTVSGGGYLGSWLISWAKRRGGIDVVQESLRGSASLLTLGSHCPGRRPENAGPDLSQPFEWVSRNSDPHSDHVRPVRLLRSYSRYLAPQAGFFSADTWTIAATWFRNTALNVLVLALFFGAASCFPGSRSSWCTSSELD